MAMLMKPQPKRARTLWHHLGTPPVCPCCGALLRVYCTRDSVQYRKCPNDCGATKTTPRK